MGWDVDFIRRRRGTDPTERTNWLELGTRDDLVERLTPVLGPPSPRVAGYWIIERDGCELRISIHDHVQPITSVGVAVYGSGDPFPTLLAIARALECEALDMVDLELLDLKSGRSGGLDLQRQVEELVAAMRRH